MVEPLLQAHGLVKHFAVDRSAGPGTRGKRVRAVDGIELTIDAGETHGLVGESGSGKSTVGRLIVRLLEPDAGTIWFKGQDLLALGGVELRKVRRDIQMIFQDSFSSLDPRYSARRIVMEPWRIHRMHSARERRRLADELLERVGLDPATGDWQPATFSGGQQQRIGIARALALEPSLIVCDEPVSALDVSVQAQIINLLQDLQEELGLGYLFIAHDLALVRHISDRVSVMYLGKIMETGTRDQVFGAPSHPYTQALLAAVDTDEGDGCAQRLVRGEPPTPIDPPSGCVFRTRCPKAQLVCAEEVPALVDRGREHPVACHFPEPAVPSVFASEGANRQDQRVEGGVSESPDA